MGFFDIFKTNDINKGIENFKKTKNAVLIDVRTIEEYEQGHIPQSTNIDVAQISTAPNIFKDKTVPIYVYCQSGARSERAAQSLKSMGYENVTNAGGIMGYTGEIEKGAGRL